MHFFTRADRVADGEDARVEHTDDVARIRLVNDFAALRHHLLRLRKLDLATALHMGDLHAFFKLAAANAHECNAVAVRLVHVRLNFEDERRKILAERVNHTLRGLARQRGGRHTQKALEERLHAEICQSGAEEHGGELAMTYFFKVKFIARAVQKLYVIAQRLAQAFAENGLKCRVVQIDLVRFDFVLTAQLFVSFKRENFGLFAVVNALEIHTGADRPVHRVGADAELFFDLIQKIIRALRVAVHLVDERENRNIAHDADFKKLSRLCLNAL